MYRLDEIVFIGNYVYENDTNDTNDDTKKKCHTIPIVFFKFGCMWSIGN